MNLKKYRRWSIYLISCLLFIFSQFYRSSIAVITPNLVNDLHLDPEELGLISAAFFCAYPRFQHDRKICNKARKMVFIDKMAFNDPAMKQVSGYFPWLFLDNGRKRL